MSRKLIVSAVVGVLLAAVGTIEIVRGQTALGVFGFVLAFSVPSGIIREVLRTIGRMVRLPSTPSDLPGLVILGLVAMCAGALLLSGVLQGGVTGGAVLVGIGLLATLIGVYQLVR